MHENRPTLGAQPGGLAQKALECGSSVDKACLVGNHFWQFHREAEILRHRRGPPLVSAKAMGSIKARVDLGGVEERCVSLKMGTDVRKAFGMLSADIPAGYSQMDVWSRLCWIIGVQHPSL